MITLDRLRVFAAVGKQHGVSRAAAELHITQPAATKQLTTLQRSVKPTLYKRSGQGVELTDSGKIFLRGARAILSQFDRFTRTFSADPAVAESETLNIGGSYSPAVELLPSLLAVFRKIHPQRSINLRTDTRAAIERMVVNSEVEIAVINSAPANRLLVIEPYRNEQLVAFGPPHPAKSRNQQLSWQKLAQTRLVIRRTVRGHSATERFLQLFKKRGLVPNIVMRCDSPDAVKTAVKNRIGIGILFKETIAHEVRSGEFDLLELPPETRIGESFIVYRKKPALSKAAQDFLTLLREHRQKLAAHRSDTKPVS